MFLNNRYFERLIDYDDRRSFTDCTAARCTFTPCNLAVQKDEVEQGH